MPQAGAF